MNNSLKLSKISFQYDQNHIEQGHVNLHTMIIAYTKCWITNLRPNLMKTVLFDGIVIKSQNFINYNNDIVIRFHKEFVYYSQ